VAQKEFAIKLTLDSIDDDIDNCFLKFVVYGQTECFVFDEVDNDLFMLKDCQMKIKAIETNAYSKYFEARVSQ
jgi:predicted nucleic acid-binding protein